MVSDAPSEGVYFGGCASALGRVEFGGASSHVPLVKLVLCFPVRGRPGEFPDSKEGHEGYVEGCPEGGPFVGGGV